MLKITRKFDYAMVAMTDLGIRGGEPTSARAIAERYHLSHSLTANVLKGLQRRALVRSTRGVHGGYLLDREPEKITLSDVFGAIEGERRITDCDGGKGKREVRCPAHSVCPVRGYVVLLGRKIQDLFAGATLADVLAASGSDGSKGKAKTRRKRRT